MTHSHAFALPVLALAGAACAHAASAPAPATNVSATAPANQLRCGPIACPAWISNEPLTLPLPLRERCALLSKVLMFQPLSLAGRPLSAFETSQQKNLGRIEDRIAVAVSLRAAGETLERSWFAAGETCGAGLLVLAPSPTHGDPGDQDDRGDARSIFRLSLSPPDPENPNALDFTLSAEALEPDVSTASFHTLSGRAERGARDAGPDNWKVVVQESVNSADALAD